MSQFDQLKKDISNVPRDTDEPKWLIWSIEHNAWWKAGRRGYTIIRSQAGHYAYVDALNIVRDANQYSGNIPKEAMILLTNY